MSRSQEEVTADIRKQQKAFQNNLWAYTGYFPDDSYGKMGEQYYKWSKRMYELVKELGIEP